MTFTAADVLISSLAESGVGPLAKAAKHGEGSHGGHVVGHTRSGKPIYQQHGAEHPAYAEFTKPDHSDAVEVHGHLHDYHQAAKSIAFGKAGGRDDDPASNSLKAVARAHHEQAKMHDEAGESHFNAAHPQLKKPHPVFKDAPVSTPALFRIHKSAKRGEGSHGGKIIGHTASGKPVYAHRQAGHSAYKSFTPKDHQDAAMHHSLEQYHAHEDEEKFGHQTETYGDEDDRKSMYAAEARGNHHYRLKEDHKRLGGGIMTTGSLPGPHLEKSAKRGEGSHGGHIVGHTKSGKPIYARGEHAGYGKQDNPDAYADAPKYHGLKSTQRAVASRKKGALGAALTHNAAIVGPYFSGTSVAQHRSLSNMHDRRKENARDSQESVGDAYSAQMLQRVWDHHNTMASVHSHIADQKSGRKDV